MSFGQVGLRKALMLVAANSRSSGTTACCRLCGSPRVQGVQKRGAHATSNACRNRDRFAEGGESGVGRQEAYRCAAAAPEPAARGRRRPARSGRSALKLQGDLWALSSAGREHECIATRLRPSQASIRDALADLDGDRC